MSAFAKGAKIVTSPRKLIKDLYGGNDDGVENVNEKEKESKKSKKYHNGNKHDKEEKNENAKNRRSRKAQNKSPDMQMNIFDEEEKMSMVKTARHIGNAVPVQLGRVIGESIKRHLKEYSKTH